MPGPFLLHPLLHFRPQTFPGAIVAGASAFSTSTRAASGRLYTISISLIECPSITSSNCSVKPMLSDEPANGGPRAGAAHMIALMRRRTIVTDVV
jgi:hypothetical protein